MQDCGPPRTRVDMLLWGRLAYGIEGAGVVWFVLLPLRPHLGAGPHMADALPMTYILSGDTGQILVAVCPTHHLRGLGCNTALHVLHASTARRHCSCTG
jgi:hypothetical protein